MFKGLSASLPVGRYLQYLSIWGISLHSGNVGQHMAVRKSLENVIWLLYYLTILPFLAVLAFKPFKGDLVLVEYSMNAGTSNINIHSVSPLNSQDMDEVIVLHVVLSWLGSCLSFLLIPFLPRIMFCTFGSKSSAEWTLLSTDWKVNMERIM